MIVNGMVVLVHELELVQLFDRLTAGHAGMVQVFEVAVFAAVSPLADAQLTDAVFETVPPAVPVMLQVNVAVPLTAIGPVVWADPRQSGSVTVH